MSNIALTQPMKHFSMCQNQQKTPSLTNFKDLFWKIRLEMKDEFFKYRGINPQSDKLFFAHSKIYF